MRLRDRTDTAWLRRSGKHTGAAPESLRVLRAERPRRSGLDVGESASSHMRGFGGSDDALQHAVVGGVQPRRMIQSRNERPSMAFEDDDERTLTRVAVPALSAQLLRDAVAASESEAEEVAITLPESARRIRGDSQWSVPQRVEWYVRLKLRQDVLGKLWARNLMPHDVLVWSHEQQDWVPLPQVSSLREYVDGMEQAWQTQARYSLSGEERRYSSSPPALTRSSVPPALPRMRAEDARDVVFRPTGRAARHMSSSIPNPTRVGDEPVIPRAPRVPSFSGALSVSREAQPLAPVQPERRRGPGEEWFVTALTQSSIVPSRASERAPAPSADAHAHSISRLPPPRAIPAALPPPWRATRPSRRVAIDHIERVVWMVAGVATMFAVMAVLGKIRRADLMSLAQIVSGASSSEPLKGALQPSRALASRALSAHVPDTVPPVPKGLKSVVVPAAVEEASSAEADDEADAQASTGPKSPSRGSARKRATAPRAVAAQPAVANEQSSPTVPSQNAEATAPPAPQAPSGVGSFDRAAARRALAGAAARASRCVQGSARGTVVVTYASSGLVQSVSLSQIEGENVSQGCIVGQFQAARVPPYFGGSVTVSKSFAMK